MSRVGGLLSLTASAGRLRISIFIIATVAIAPVAIAQDRPDEAELFGAGPGEGKVPPQPTPASANAGESPSQDAATSPKKPTPTQEAATRTEAGSHSAAAGSSSGSPPAVSKEATRDSQILGSSEAAPMFTEEAAPEDPLKIGGQLYLRMQSTGSQGQKFTEFSFSAPSLLDVYLDARPNDRVRGFVLGRMLYDPTLPANTSNTISIAPLSATGTTSGSPSLSSLFQQQTRGPQVYLDQLWLRFDIARRVFVTVGQQHVRWGTGHFWAPTDYLHLRPRNPLDVFDARTGTSMVKLHLPIESKQWNFYAYGVTEGTDPTPTLGSLAGAARAEFVLGTTELGLGAFAQKDMKPKYAADLSTGIGDFDFYGELALRYLNDIDRVRYEPNATIPTYAAPLWQSPTDAQSVQFEQTVDAIYPVYRPSRNSSSSSRRYDLLTQIQR